MANSGIKWVDSIFDWCVIALYQMAGWLGITYEEINIWIFCVTWPLLTLALILFCARLWHQNAMLRRLRHASQ
jgi:hypothetical protein